VPVENGIRPNRGALGFRRCREVGWEDGDVSIGAVHAGYQVLDEDRCPVRVTRSDLHTPCGGKGDGQITFGRIRQINGDKKRPVGTPRGNQEEGAEERREHRQGVHTALVVSQTLVSALHIYLDS